MPLIVRAVVAWLLLLVAMIGNGFVRGLVLQPRLGEDRARQVASLIGVGIVCAIAGAFVATLDSPAPGALVRIGCLWLALTLGFEFLFGHFVVGASWQALLADYDLAHGRLWPLVLLATALAPWVWGALLRDRS
jgi:hypothetical protein